MIGGCLLAKEWTQSCDLSGPEQLAVLSGMCIPTHRDIGLWAESQGRGSALPAVRAL